MLDALAASVRILGRPHGLHFAAVRHGAGLAFGGRLLAIGLGAMLCLSVAIVAHLAVSEWVQNRYASSELSRAAGLLSFVIVLGVLGLGLAHFL